MRCWLLGFALGCGASAPNPPRPPDRAADVLIAAPPDLVVLYRDGDGEWQHAPRLGSDTIGFDLESQRYAVAVIDAASGNITSRYTTVDEQPDLELRGGPTSAVHTISGAVFGLPQTGGIIFGSSELAAVGDGEPFAFDEHEGLATIVAYSLRSFIGTPTLLALRRDVILAEPLEINIDLATEGLPVMRTQVSHPSCTLVSTFSFGQTRVELANVSDTIIYAPHPEQWRVGDRLSVLRLCDGRSYVVDDLVSPFQALPPFEQPPNVDPLAPDVSNDRWHFAWNAYESPVEYELVVAGDPCFPLVLVGVEALSRGCRHRWTARITEGWTAGGGTELDVISRAELEALGVWSDSLELPHPLSWALFADRDGTDRRTRAFHNGTIE